MLEQLYGEALLTRAEAYLEAAQTLLHKMAAEGVSRHNSHQASFIKTIVDFYVMMAGKLAPDVYGDYYHQIKQVERDIKLVAKEIDDLRKQAKKGA